MQTAAETLSPVTRRMSVRLCVKLRDEGRKPSKTRESAERRSSKVKRRSLASPCPQLQQAVRRESACSLASPVDRQEEVHPARGQEERSRRRLSWKGNPTAPSSA
eukprot:755961-Hanusia_phi.AAC.7